MKRFVACLLLLWVIATHSAGNLSAKEVDRGKTLPTPENETEANRPPHDREERKAPQRQPDVAPPTDEEGGGWDDNSVYDNDKGC